MSPVKKVGGKKIPIEEFLDPWQIKRRQRIAFIIELLKSGSGVEVNHFLGSMSTKHGIRRQTLKEYLKDLKDYGVIEIVNGRIRWIGEETGGEGDS